MMCLEDTWFVAAIHSTPMHDLGLKEVQRFVVLRALCKTHNSHLHLLSSTSNRNCNAMSGI